MSWASGATACRSSPASRTCAGVVIVTLSAAIVAAGLLFLVFRTAQARIARQTEALLESTRRDPLTDTLNHGALVGYLAQEIERGREDIRPIGIALIDLDNFRLLNDNHGHAAGDEALLAVAGTLREHVDAGMELGRYGPDEFLLVATPAAVAHLEPVVQRLRAALVDLSLRFSETERLPITVSVGIATYPDHASSVTALLAVAAGVLEAKASGEGHGPPEAREDGEDDAANTSFDVLQGLVIAIDTKDRYTKRHSEDVARFSTFIARRIGLPADEMGRSRSPGACTTSVRSASPAPIMRKLVLAGGGARWVQQHVALGDMIVRDLPTSMPCAPASGTTARRWDGQGYLDRLAGETIRGSADPRGRRRVLGDDDDPSVSGRPRHPRGADAAG